VWSILALGIVLAPRIIRTCFPGDPIKVEIKTLKKIKLFRKAQRKKQWNYKRKRYHTPPSKFNPNEYSLSQWMELGLTEKQANVVLKFCKYPLKSNADLKRIFVIPDALFERIKDSTFYPDKPSDKLQLQPSSHPEKQQLLTTRYGIETIDSTQLVSIKGIGPFYAKMIMRYERSLGGFLKPEQLLEVYKMTPEIYALLCDRLDFSVPNIRQISINKASVEALDRHPYLNRWQANSIVKMRIQLGGFQSLNELRKSHLINAEDFEKLEPYVSL
jgi:DNA uptake protein ComE-like DNA-binding protein